MRFYGISLGCAFLFTGGAPAQDGERPKQGTDLADAVREFNVKHERFPDGKDQPPLTVDEVIAAVRAWEPANARDHAALLRGYKKTIEEKRLPAGARLRHYDGWRPEGKYIYEVWAIEVELPGPEGKRWKFYAPVRKRFLRSRTLQEELERYERLLKTADPRGRPLIEENIKQLKEKIKRLGAEG